MNSNAIENKIYTYDDYLNFADNEVVEIIDGKIFAMSPAPSRMHQEIITDIITEIRSYIKNNKGTCKVYPAPFDVILKNNDEELKNSKNIVQPDISVICDKNKLTDKGCTGSPDMIVEVVSLFNPSNDYIKKLSLYQEYKVKEYWIVNPMQKAILVYKLEGELYGAPTSYTFNDQIKVGIFENLIIDFKSFEI
ncbi:Uma2 family endonuclease [Clostridium sp. DSM 100503]|uniref:Uma2 family endonuclease n=1 Tax=Clostridium sp. DSM 100503 TaxID=2963282 RepID=UPI00214A16AD|nr:Uma2 family endonuclease [Clostridium sp. DSM 100503]MCR1953173.1 Uma2 family endonuclease [Clostridium sp. DSM 100503]